MHADFLIMCITDANRTNTNFKSYKKFRDPALFVMKKESRVQILHRSTLDITKEKKA